MKNFLLTLVIIFTSICTYSQSNFIEVTVSELVELKATEFIYTLSSKESWEDAMDRLDFYSEENDDLEPDDELPQLTINDVAKILKKEKFNFKRSADQDYSLSGEEGDLIVMLESVDELNRLKKRLLKENMSLKGKITETIYETIDSHYATVYPILMEKAREQATLLANSADRKVGKVLSISDLSQSSNGGDFWSDYMKSIMDMMKDREGDQLVGFKQHAVTKSYRFELL